MGSSKTFDPATLLKRVLFFIAVLGGWGLVTLLVGDKIVMPIIVKHGRNVRVPDIVEYQADVAKEEVEKAGFVLVVDGEEYDQQVPEGAIISQNPSAYAVTKPGRRIHVMVSTGPEMVAMMDVTGISLRQAKIFLRDMGLEEGRVIRVYSSTYPRNVVIKQTVPPDSLVPLGTLVDLTVSIK